MSHDAGDVAAIVEAVGLVGGIGLEELEATAALQLRRDRKYVLDVATAAALLVSLTEPRWRVLEIGAERAHRYESVYFDTAAFDLHRDAAHGRRRRYKVRTRLYSDGTEMLEVKTRTGRGDTAKGRCPLPDGDRAALGPRSRAFVEEIVDVPGAADALTHSLRTTYDRVALVDVELRHRLTVDLAVRCVVPSGAGCAVAGVVVESKTHGQGGVADRLLWRMGHRPVRLSKYCTGLAALNVDLPRNKWHRTIQRHIHLL